MSLALARLDPGAAPRHHLKIQDPETFKGDREKLRPFLALLRLKASTYPNEADRLRYAVSVLGDSALDEVLPYIQNNQVNLPDLAALITILETAFSNPNRVQEAAFKLAYI